jgi:hypothetical protein
LLKLTFMSFNMLIRLLPLVLLLVSSFLFAQKPRPSNSLEIKLSPENDAWHIEGNMRISETTGFPAAIYQVNFPVTKAEPETMVREYLLLNRSVLGLTTDNIQNLKLHAVRQSQTGVTVRLRQMWKGLPVNKNAEMTIHITPDNVVSFVMNGLQSGVSLANITPTITATAASQSVINRLNMGGNISYEANKLMVLHHDDKDYLVYNVTEVSDQPVGEWEAYVDAQAGTLLKVEEVSAYHHHEPLENNLPWTFGPLTTVNGTGNVFAPDPLSTANAVYGTTGYVDGSDANIAQLIAQNQSITLLDITLNAGIHSLVGPYAEIKDFEAPNKGLFTQASSAFDFLRFDDAFEAVNC